MQKILELLEKKILPPLLKVSENRYLMGIKEGMMIVIPFTIIGSVFLIIGNIPIDWWTNIIAPYNDILNAGVSVTFGIIGLLATIGTGYHLAKAFKVDAISNTTITVVGFLLATISDDFSINTAAFDASGMFTGLVVAVFVVTTYRFFIHRKITIKMPAGVPSGVANSFVSLLPGAFIVLIIWIARVLLGFDINEFLRIIFSPLVKGIGTLPGFIAFAFLANALWVAGIHGDSLLSGISTPIFIGLLAENLKAFQSGAAIPNVTPDGFWILYACIGGSGATLGLVFLMLRSKSKVYNSVGKVSVLPALFCINEPVIFGFPIVMNPIMAIPFVVTPIILTIMTYLLTHFGIIGKIVFAVPWTIPPIIGPYLATNGSIPAAIWSACTIIISYLCYRPFFKVEEKKQLLVETKQ